MHPHGAAVAFNATKVSAVLPGNLAYWAALACGEKAGAAGAERLAALEG